MLRRRIDSLLSTILLAIIVPFVLFSALRSRIGFARPKKRSRKPVPTPSLSPSPAPIAGEFQFDRAVPAYEHLIDSVIAEERA